jgi:nitrile hydratase
MNGVHDMGGMHGFGPVVPEPDEPPFHAPWEKRAFALTLAMGIPGGWNLDMSRFARESMAPANYLASSYYEIWIAGLQTLMLQRGLISKDEIGNGHAQGTAKPVTRILTAPDVEKVLYRGAPTHREVNTAARFPLGARVRMKNINPPTHTRLPRYVRGHVGMIDLVHGAHVFADTHARGEGENPQWLYTVRFDGRELWGADADPTVSVSVDAWEPYLEPA